MKRKLHSFKLLLTLSLVMVMSVLMALPPETEYSGIIPLVGSDGQGPAQGYRDDVFWGPDPIGFSFTFFGNDYTEFYVTSNGVSVCR